MAYTDATYIKEIAQVKYNQYVSGTFASEAAFSTWITANIVPNAQNIVENYCHTTWTDATVPAGVKEATAQVGARMLHIMLLRKQGPLVKTGDYRIEFAESFVLSDEIKALLAPYVEDTKYVEATEYQSDEIEDQWE